MASTAEQLYEKITMLGSGYTFVESFISRGTQETEWLEFKSADRIDEKHAKEHWSKALSGFANTEGGVLVWGINANRNKETGIDCASSLALVPDPDLFAQKLNDVVLEAVVPALTGIQIKAIKKDGQKEGFVVCLIPEGTSKAHRAELVENKPFLMRSRDKFFIPAVSTIRNLFMPRESAHLVPSVTVVPQTVKDLLTVWVALKNEGNLTAKNITLIIHHPRRPVFQALQSAYTQQPTILEERIPLFLNTNINPDMTQDTIFGFKYLDVNSALDDFEIMIKVSCEDCPSLNWTRKFSDTDMLKPHRLAFTPVTK